MIDKVFLIGKILGVIVFMFGAFIILIFDKFFREPDWYFSTRKRLERIFLILLAVFFACGVGVLILTALQ